MDPDFRHLKPLEPAAKALKNKGFDLQKVKHAKNRGPIGLCYWNSDTYAAENQGCEVVHGWMFSNWPKVMIVGYHHAVVKLESGELLDVTEIDQKGSYTCFAIDESVIPSRDAPAFIPNKHFRILKTPAVQEWIDAQKHRLDLQREIVQKAVASGAKWTPERGIAGDQADLAKMQAAERRTSHAYTLIDSDLQARR